MHSALVIEIAKKGRAMAKKAKTPEGEEYEEEKEGEGDPVAEVKASAAADMFAAIKDDDQEAFAVALDEYVSACMG